MPTPVRHQEIKLALMDVPGVDPDDEALVKRVDDVLMRVLPRVKSLTGLTDDEIAHVVGKSRPTVQAYIGGRLREQLPEWAYDRLIGIVKAKQVEVGYLLRDLQQARQKAS